MKQYFIQPCKGTFDLLNILLQANSLCPSPLSLTM